MHSCMEFRTFTCYSYFSSSLRSRENQAAISKLFFFFFLGDADIILLMIPSEPKKKRHFCAFRILVIYLLYRKRSKSVFNLQDFHTFYMHVKMKYVPDDKHLRCREPVSTKKALTFSL